MKPKFKLGMMIRTDAGEFGLVEGVVTRSNGYFYEVSGDEVSEDRVVGAFKEIKAKAAKETAPGKRRGRKPKMKASEELNF